MVTAHTAQAKPSHQGIKKGLRRAPLINLKSNTMKNTAKVILF